ncbi:hypothetical protein [Dysgonomonas sp. 520]|uniref:hypothetical protein n=1 Tax=Dysgonomonas sp. 520 TaxID=2302931 RepID=UPI0013D19DE1|nr:hypothetical protein [Dysgonomonas sp. 520]
MATLVVGSVTLHNKKDPHIAGLSLHRFQFHIHSISLCMQSSSFSHPTTSFLLISQPFTLIISAPDYRRLHHIVLRDS